MVLGHGEDGEVERFIDEFMAELAGQGSSIRNADNPGPLRKRLKQSVEKALRLSIN